MPITLRAATVSVRLQNPDFEYMFFDDEDVERFIDREFPQYRPHFEAFPVKIQRYDFFRYLAVYRYGGFYLDTDVLCAKPFDELLAHTCVFPFEEMSIHDYLLQQHGLDWEIGNYAFGAVAGHPFVEAIIKNCIRAQQDPDWAQEMLRPIPRMFRGEYFVFDTTGPGLVSRTLGEYANAGGDVTILFPDDVRDPSDWHCFGDYAVHLQGGSWRSQKNIIYRRLFRLWEKRQRQRRAEDSDRRGPKRSLPTQPPT